MDKNMKKSGSNKPGNKNLKWLIMTFAVIILAIALFVPSFMNSSRTSSVSYSEFLNQVQDKQVQNVEIEGSAITYTKKDDDKKFYRTEMVNDPGLVDRLIEGGASFTEVPVKQNSFLTTLLIYMAPWLLIWLAVWLFIRNLRKRANNQSGGGFTFTGGNGDNGGDSGDDDSGGSGFPFGNLGNFGMGNMGKTNAKVYKGEMTHTTFKDVAGQDEAKQNLKEIVSFLNNPGRYTAIGAKMPKGALLVGPPGTGKTLLARAVAGEAGVPFYFIAGSEFVEMFVGRGAARVRDLFKEARKHAPCIIFIDEIDTIGKKRDGSGFSGNDEREQTLNQLLAEMDGFDGSKGIVLLAATNRPETLDPALTRPGRFDRRIPVELPDLEGRTEILELHAKNVKMAPNIDYNMIARASAGTSGADLANIVIPVRQ